MKKIKVFISSPSDVEQERSIAMTVLNRLNRRYKEHLEIEGIFWKDKPLFASDHFQEQIEDPSTADIVVVILWSRLGTNLSLEYKGEISGKQPVTGTEWEFEDAMSHYKSCGKPEVIVYKKNSDVFGVVGDKEEYDKKSREKAVLDDFMKYWFVHDDGLFKAAFHQFEELQEFENRLETHLEELMKTYIKKMIGEETRWFKGSPFRGLNSFELEHEDIFFGRREQIYQIRTIFLNLEKEKHPFLLVIGASGCGKSSLLKAGVLPYLLQSDVVKDVAIIRHSIFKPNDNPTDLLLSLSAALFKTFEEELKTLSYSSKTLKEALLLDIKPIKQVINKIRYEKKLIKEATVKIVIIIDQFEEIFTNRAFSKEQKEQFIKIINTFVKSGYFWVLASMRSDFIKDIDDLSELKELLSHKESRYLLSFPSVSQTRELIIKPANEAGVRYERKNGKDLDEVLLENATKNGTSLPLLEYVLEELYIARDEENLLTFTSYEKMGEIEGAVGQKAEAVYNNLTSSGKKAFESLIRMLVTISQKDVRQRSAKTITYDSIKENREKVNIIEVMSSKKVRLFVKDRDSFGNIVIRVAHEALFNNWDRAVNIILSSGQDIIVRERLEKLSHDWKSAQKKDKKSLLLNDGLPINKALDLVSRRGDELSSDILSFIEKSQDRVKQKRWQKRGVLVAGVIGLFVIYGSMQTVKAKEEQAQRSKEETQKLANFMLNDLKDKLAPIGRTDILRDVQSEVGRYLKSTESQNSSKPNDNVEEVKKTIEKILQEQQKSMKILSVLQSYQNTNNIYREMMKDTLEDEYDSVKFSTSKKMQIEIKKYLKSTDNQDKSTDTLSLQAKFYSNEGDIYKTDGKLKKSLKEYQSAVEIYKELIELEPDNTKWKQNLALMYDNIGLSYNKMGDLQIALDFFQYTKKIKENLIKLEPNNNQWQYDISKSYRYIAWIYDKQGKTKEAIELQKESFKIRKKLTELEHDNNKWQRALALSYVELGDIYYFTLQEYDKALQEYGKAFEIRKKLVDFDSNNNIWKNDLTKSYRDLGSIYQAQGILLWMEAEAFKLYKKPKEATEKYQESTLKYQEAEVEYLNALKINKELVDFDPNNTWWLVSLSSSYLFLGNNNKLQSNLDKALKYYKNVKEIYIKLLTIDSSNSSWQALLASSYENLGDIYNLEEKYQDALNNYNEAQAIKENLVELDPNNRRRQDSLASNYYRTGNIYKAFNKPWQALKQLEKSFDIAKKLIEFDSKNHSWQVSIRASLEYMSIIYTDLDRLKEAKDILEIYEWLISLDPSSLPFQQGMHNNNLNLFKIAYNPEKIITNEVIKYLQDTVSFLQKLQDDVYLHKSMLTAFENSKNLLKLALKIYAKNNAKSNSE